MKFPVFALIRLVVTISAVFLLSIGMLPIQGVAQSAKVWGKTVQTNLGPLLLRITTEAMAEA